MALPQALRVKLSSEEAGYLSMTPVVVQEMALRDLVERMLGIAGKDPERIADLLLRGVLVSGATRFRWQGFHADPAEVAALLATFPDAEPERPFCAGRCVRVALCGPHGRVEISRQAGSRRRWLRRRSFWDALMEETAQAAPEYREYSYKERADCYRLRLTRGAEERLRQHAALLAYSVLQDRVRAGGFETVEFYVARE
ncbi:MAG: hypothetical protein RMI94_13695 [Bryobacterales bacterium]|nr:hypothetical protein [Bryobacterales bacterium]